MGTNDFKKKQSKNGLKNTSELRQDLVTGDWVLIATNRAKRPRIAGCPFENPQASGNSEPLLIFYNGKNWTLQVIANKFPAVSPENRPELRREGPYTLMDSAGFHEVIITRDHKQHMALMPVKKIEEILKAYQQRYLALMDRPNVAYISIFHNHGKEAGASLEHPHSQLIAMPIVPADVSRSLKGSKKYHEEHNYCAHCAMIEWEKKAGRSIFRNKHFIVFTPFAPRTAFELRIYPRKHQSNFERINDEERRYLAEALRQALARICKALKNPAYNFFIHTAPCDDKDYNFYHWHIEILPKRFIWSGFELSTGIEISTIRPEQVAELLRKIKI